MNDPKNRKTIPMSLHLAIQEIGFCEALKGMAVFAETIGDMAVRDKQDWYDASCLLEEMAKDFAPQADAKPFFGRRKSDAQNEQNTEV